VRYESDWRRYRRASPYDLDLRSDWGREPRQDGWEWTSGPAPESYPQPRLHGPARYGFGPYHERLRRRGRSDEELRQDVEDALFFDTWVNADAISVDVKDGVVTLRGELPSYDEVRFATDDAWDIEGVLGVRAELRVSGSD
jgi:hypothetical protein